MALKRYKFTESRSKAFVLFIINVGFFASSYKFNMYSYLSGVHPQFHALILIKNA